MTSQPSTRQIARQPETPARRGALAVELRMAIMRTSRRLRQEVRSAEDVTPGQATVLAVLERHGPSTPGELADHEKVQPPSMTRTLAALETRGLISRTEHPTDRRQVLVSLNEDGVAVVRDIRRRRDAWLARRLARLSPADRATLAQAAAILNRISAE